MKYIKKYLSESHLYVTAKEFTFSLEDGKFRQFGVIFETTDMYDATGDKEFKEYPFIVSAQIMADRCHKSFNENDRVDVKPSKQDLLFDCLMYLGGVPIDHILTDSILGGSELGQVDAFQNVAGYFNINEACVKTAVHQCGTIAAQRGKVEFKHLQFKTEEAATKFIDYIVAHRLSALSTMIGLILDKPVNLMGTTGWETIEKQVKGRKQYSKTG